MRNLKPLIPSTAFGAVGWEWVPADWLSFVRELEGVAEQGRGLDHLLLFRGQRDSAWLLDSTFARECKKHLFGIDKEHRLSSALDVRFEHQRLVTERLLFKFGVATRPSEELFTLEAANGIDAWFEWMKHLQQYPEEDQPHPQLGFENWYLLGTFIMDWTRDQNVALYFANGRTRSGDGALWVVDASATGKTLHRDRSVRSILDQMKTASQRGESLGVPLLICAEVIDITVTKKPAAQRPR
jgi:FRG domain